MIRRRRISLWCATVGLLLGGELIVLSIMRLRDKGEDARRYTHGEAGQLAVTLRETALAVSHRAGELARLPALRAAVATDSATLEDIVVRDAAFAVQPAESLHVFQVGRDGSFLRLLRRPASGPAPAQSTVRTNLRRELVMQVDQGALLVSAPRPVEALYRTDEISGALVVTRRIDLEAIAGRLGAAGVDAALVVGENKLTLSGPSGATEQPGLVEARVRLEGALSRDSVVLYAAPSATSMARIATIRYSGLGVLALGLLLALAFGLRRKSEAQAEAAADAEQASSEEQEQGQQPPLVALDAAPAPGFESSSPAGSSDSPVMLAAGGAAAALQTVSLLEDPSLDELFASRFLKANQVVAGRYRIVRHLATGGLAEVYLARTTDDDGRGRDVALKMLRRDLAEPEVLEQFLDEARIAAQVVHGNIARVYNLGLVGHSYFIAMEYVDGNDLDVLLARLRRDHESIPLPVALAIAIQMCHGLHAAHIAADADGTPLGIVHRDVKPSNVLLGNDGSVKITDFGIAKANKGSHVTDVGMVKGTVNYMAPEQRIGTRVDARTDVYGVGAVLYELCAGRRADLDLARLAYLDRAGWPHLLPPTAVRPELPREIDEIIFRALEYDPAERQGSCATLAVELELLCVRQGSTALAKTIALWLAGRRARTTG